NRFKHFSCNRIRQIATGGEDHLQLAPGIDDQCPEIMVNKTAVALKFYIRVCCQLGELLDRAGKECPVARVVLITFGISLKHGGCVEFRIESDRQEMPVSG